MLDFVTSPIRSVLGVAEHDFVAPLHGTREIEAHPTGAAEREAKHVEHFFGWHRHKKPAENAADQPDPASTITRGPARMVVRAPSNRRVCPIERDASTLEVSSP